MKDAIGRWQQHWARRTAGLAMLVAAVVAFKQLQPGLWQDLWLPLSVAFAAWLILNNLLAVALAACALALAHMQLDATDWVLSIAYPTIAAIGAIASIVVLWRRLQAQASETHQERWQARQQADDNSANAPHPADSVEPPDNNSNNNSKNNGKRDIR